MNRLQHKQLEINKIQQYGFVTHYAPCGHYSTHTHGLEVTQKHKNLEVYLHIDSIISHTIITNVVNLIKTGKVLQEGEYNIQWIQSFNKGN